MGMFDNLKCELVLPNLPPEFLAQRGGNSFEISWQTKDLDNAMSYYKITEDGFLQVRRHEGNWVEGKPLEDLENASFSEKMKALGHFDQTKTWFEPVIGFTGSINFYEVWYHSNYKHILDTDHKFSTGWVEYKAVFHLGFLTSIELFSVDEPIEYTEEQIQENEIKFKLQRQELENSCRENRAKYPSPHHKLIDSIMDIIHSQECIHDEWGMVSKLNTIEDAIIEYRKQYDIWK